ncbi:MAG TPA: hypothetical protein VIG52_07485 [Methyloceanibacter sp.]|jgi:RNase P subunit RPR2
MQAFLRRRNLIGMSDVSEIITGNSYFVTTCTQCETMMIFGDALSSDAGDPRHAEAFLTCPTCLQKDVYQPEDMRIARAAQKH